MQMEAGWAGRAGGLDVTPVAMREAVDVSSATDRPSTSDAATARNVHSAGELPPLGKRKGKKSSRAMQKSASATMKPLEQSPLASSLKR